MKLIFIGLIMILIGGIAGYISGAVFNNSEYALDCLCLVFIGHGVASVGYVKLINF